jgi:hypothetical protein
VVQVSLGYCFVGLLLHFVGLLLHFVGLPGPIPVKGVPSMGQVQAEPGAQDTLPKQEETISGVGTFPIIRCYDAHVSA